jgi:pyruvate dehydrogenase E2 component (dihydrolipoamide acetyltransferase)
VPFEFRLPDIGEGIDAAEIIEWHVAVGDCVKEDQPLADIQTDKANVELPCPTTGKVLELCAEVGDTVVVGALLAVFAPVTGGSAAESPPETQRSRRAIAETAASPSTPAASSVVVANRPLASPAVRRLARSARVNLAEIAGSGPSGRITRADVETAIGPSDELGRSAGARLSDHGAIAPTRGSSRGSPAQPEGRTVPLRGTRRAIARTLTKSWQTIPHIIDYRELDATELTSARSALKAQAEKAGDERLAGALTATPLVVKMVATALPRHPYANALIDLEREEITFRSAVNVGVAVAAPQGIVAPVLQKADQKSVVEIAVEILDLVETARASRLSPEQLADGVITVNNYGSLGVWLGTPIISPGQVVNFGIGKLEKKPVVRDDQIVSRPIVPIAVSGDHRLLDGDTLAAFVSDVAAMFENPSLLFGELR